MRVNRIPTVSVPRWDETLRIHAVLASAFSVLGSRSGSERALRTRHQTVAPPQVIVVQHWAEELKRLVPN